MLRALALVLLLTIAPAIAGVAAIAQAQDAASRVPLPQVPRGQGERCVADTDFMRRNHMAILKHQRDETMHRGIRPKDVRLTACIACHAVQGGDGKPVSYADPRHFCRSCHTYAAVAVDCFECHASRPEAKAKAATSVAPDLAALSNYLRSQQP